MTFTHRKATVGGEDREATFSTCELYRYVLRITWDKSLPVCQFIGLNPSTADELQDDPTLRRCKAFAASWGCGSLVMTNAFAFRATDPKVMKARRNPVGETNGGRCVNTEFIETVSNHSKIVIAAWGVHGEFLCRDMILKRILGSKLQCLGLTKGGHPKHPLYLKKDLTPMAFKL